MPAPTTHAIDIVAYYEAFEALLGGSRVYTHDHRTHFGTMEADEVGPDYCFLATAARADLAEPGHLTAMRGAMDRLHARAFGELAPRRILDVGFGAGGTLCQFAREHPDAELVGVNVNAVQHQIATTLLGGRARLHLGDFLDMPPERPFDLVTFIESAFHFSDKDALCARITDSLAPGGELVVVDIFTSARTRRPPGRRAGTSGIFDYLDVDTWTAVLGRHGIEVTGFDETTQGVARHIRMRTPPAEARTRYFEPAAAGRPDADAIVNRLAAAWEGYRRLGALLDRGLLRYGILRARRC